MKNTETVDYLAYGGTPIIPWLFSTLLITYVEVVKSGLLSKGQIEPFIKFTNHWFWGDGGHG